MTTNTAKKSEGKVFFGSNSIAQRKSFLCQRDAIDFANSLINHLKTGGDTVFFETKISGKNIILQCQEAGCFLQIFCPDKNFDGWLTALADETIAEGLDVEDEELIIPCYDEDEPRETHFRLIGIEGTWAANQLLVSKERALLALEDIYTFEATGVWRGKSFWADLGVI